MRKLRWDSDFWGIDIFQLNVNNEVNFELPTGSNFVVQALCEINDANSIKKLEQKGFSLKETKVTLQKKIFEKVEMNNSNFRKLSIDDLKSLENILFGLFGGNSRFDIFPTEKVNEFYYTWLINSVTGEMDDECIGYFKGNKLAGFVTYRIQDLKVVIGLIGVVPNFQGQGISQLLLEYIDDITMKNTLKTASISTQGTNINALNAYIKNGYSIHRIDYWYYYVKGDIK